MNAKEKKKVKGNNHPRILTVSGQAFADDADLQATIKKLLPTASISQIFSEISKWEDKAVVKDKLTENTQKTGKLIISCQR